MSKPVVLTPKHAAFDDDCITVGYDASAEDLANLRAAWADGVESGAYEPWETTGS